MRQRIGPILKSRPRSIDAERLEKLEANRSKPGGTACFNWRRPPTAFAPIVLELGAAPAC